MGSLCYAVRTGDLDVLKSAIKDGSVHVNAMNKDDVSACHIIIGNLIDMNYSK